MPFMKYAAASVVRPHVSRNQWGRIRTAGETSTANGDLNGNLIERASEMFQRSFRPDDYLLTHATIIASVDAYEPQGVKTGSVLEDGFRVNRKFGDYRISPTTDRYINNNLDAWNRDVLMSSFPTFIGAHNFVEHVQIEDLSKGRVIDAVARDIGDSIYVDILIATDKRHRDLVAAIQNGKMGTLSMGCTVDGTICTRCGHWAADETEMCPHVKFGKGNTFYDAEGRKHRVAELCGHQSIDPHGGVQFIEASWVASPAFTGAVLRNVLEPTAEISRQAQHILATPPPQWSKEDVMKAAGRRMWKGWDGPLAVQAATQGPEVARIDTPTSQKFIVQNRVADDLFLAGWMDEGEGGEEEGGGGGTEEAKPPLQEVEDELTTYLRNRVKRRIQEEMRNVTMDEALSDESSTAPNDTVIKEARQAYLAGLQVLVRTASSDVDLVNSVADLNHKAGIEIPIPIYRVALKVGALSQYDTTNAFRMACCRALGRNPTRREATVLLRFGKMLSRRGQ